MIGFVALLGDQVTLRMLLPDDVHALMSIGRAPELARRWPGLDEAELGKKVAGLGEAVCFSVLEVAPLSAPSSTTRRTIRSCGTPGSTRARPAGPRTRSRHGHGAHP